jgi:hypothetical protein
MEVDIPICMQIREEITSSCEYPETVGGGGGGEGSANGHRVGAGPENGRARGGV